MTLEKSYMMDVERNALKEQELGEQASLDSRITEARDLSEGYAQRLNADDMEMVDLSQIADTPEVQGPADFSEYSSYDSLRREVQMHEQMRPYIEQGATVDDFNEWDKHNHIGAYSEEGHIRGYVDTYHAYYGNDDAMVLSQEADGTYSIDNGRHRIFLARELGLKQIPARVQRRI